MNDADRHRLLRLCGALAVLAALASACARLPAPTGWAPSAEEAGRDPRGAWTNVRCHEGDETVTHSGELLAVDQDSLYLAVPGDTVLSFAWPSIRRVQSVLFDPLEGAAYGLGAAGAFSTLSHGWFMALSFPIWLGISAGAGGGRVDEAVTGYPRETEDPNGLRPYARFPQGMPEGMRHATIAVTPEHAREQFPPPQIYAPPSHAGSGLIGQGGIFEGGNAAWSVGYHQRVKSELFVLGGYTSFDEDVYDMDQWWAGVRVGAPLFIGVKYIHTAQNGLDGNGASVFAGFITPTAERVAFGAMIGYDDTAMNASKEGPLFGPDNFLWAAIMLQLVLSPAR